MDRDEVDKAVPGDVNKRIWTGIRRTDFLEFLDDDLSVYRPLMLAIGPMETVIDAAVRQFTNQATAAKPEDP